MTIYLAILKDEKRTVVIEFLPLFDGPEFAGIEIVSMDIQPRPRSAFELRLEDRRKHGKHRRRGVMLDDQEQHAEAMLPTTRREQMDLFTKK